MRASIVLLWLAFVAAHLQAQEPDTVSIWTGKLLSLQASAPTADPEPLRRLGAELERALVEMAPRVPIATAGLARLVITVEPDFPSQARRTGRLGPAIPGGPADLHLVFHPDDFFAYRHALADRLLERASRFDGLPPGLRRGAALWLAREWYGRPYEGWLPVFATVGVLPSVSELLASSEPRDGSEPLWTPAAAAVIEHLPGPTLAAKLEHGLSEDTLGKALRQVEQKALAAASGRAALVPAPVTVPVTVPGFLHGISFAMWNSLEGGYHAPAVDSQLERLAMLGADAIALMPFAYQRHPRQPGLVFLNRHPASETDVGVIHAARRAHARGMRVLWKPHLWISHSSWPGEVEMTSEADWHAWWTVYRRYVLHHAFLAAWTKSELFSVGVELSLTQRRESEWRRLIGDVRRLYSGVVTYSSNWHGGLDEVRFWDALDLVGVDAYYPLAGSPGASPRELTAGAVKVVERLENAARSTGKPLLLTEIGFSARRAAWVEPHGEGGELSLADQAAAYRALLDVLGRRPWLAGAFFWKAFSSAEAEQGHEPDFRFLGRPAEAEICRWFRAGRK